MRRGHAKPSPPLNWTGKKQNKRKKGLSVPFECAPATPLKVSYGGVRILLWKRGFCWNRRLLTTSNLETHADLHHLSQDHLGPQRDDWRLGKTVSYAVRRRLVQLIVYFDKLYKCSPSSTPRCSVAALKQRVQCPLRHSNRGPTSREFKNAPPSLASFARAKKL